MGGFWPLIPLFYQVHRRCVGIASRRSLASIEFDFINSDVQTIQQLPSFSGFFEDTNFSESLISLLQQLVDRLVF